MAKRVLIIDDSPIIHKLLKRTLERSNFEVCGNATNGKEGVDMYSFLKPDIVFMDITMPVMDGLKASKAIRDLDKNAKIIMLSDMGDEEIISEANSAGINVFIQKPFDDVKIISAISLIESA